MFRATMCPSSGETTIYATLGICHSVWMSNDEWWWWWWWWWSTECRVDMVVSPDDGHIVTRNMYRKERNILRKIVHHVGFIYNSIQECTVNKT